MQDKFLDLAIKPGPLITGVSQPMPGFVMRVRFLGVIPALCQLQPAGLQIEFLPSHSYEGPAARLPRLPRSWQGLVKFAESGVNEFKMPFPI